MSLTNIEAVRQAVGLFNAGDLDAWVEMASPEHEWVVAREHPHATTHHGVDAARAYLVEWRTMLEGMRLEIDELLDRGERVVLVARLRGVGAGSGADVEVKLGIVITFRDGLAVRTEEFLDPAEALRSAE